jgi:hypothetical protein
VLPIIDFEGQHGADRKGELLMYAVEVSFKSSESVSEMINQAQEALGLSDQHVAEALGYDKSVVVRMLKTGNMRLPIGKVPQLAYCLRIEPRNLMRKVLGEISPDVLEAIESCYGPFDPSPAEARLITAIRTSAGGRETATVLFDKESIIALVVA